MIICQQLKKLLVISLSMIEATDFIRNGSVAIIPTNVSNIELISLFNSRNLSFSLTDDEVTSISEMTLVVTNEEEINDGSPLSQQKNTSLLLRTLKKLKHSLKKGATRDGKAIAKMINFGLLKQMVTT